MAIDYLGAALVDNPISNSIRILCSQLIGLLPMLVKTTKNMNLNIIGKHNGKK